MKIPAYDPEKSEDMALKDFYSEQDKFRQLEINERSKYKPPYKLNMYKRVPLSKKQRLQDELINHNLKGEPHG
jgi:hypothetical protein